MYECVKLIKEFYKKSNFSKVPKTTSKDVDFDLLGLRLFLKRGFNSKITLVGLSDTGSICFQSHFPSVHE